MQKTFEPKESDLFPVLDCLLLFKKCINMIFWVFTLHIICFSQWHINVS